MFVKDSKDSIQESKEKPTGKDALCGEDDRGDTQDENQAVYILHEPKSILEKLNPLIQLCALIISGLALWIAGQSLQTAEGARDDVRAIEHLELKPQLRFHARLFPERYGYLEHQKESSFTIANVGPIDALQVNVEFLDICINKTKNKISSWGRDFNLSTFVGNLAPYERMQITLDQNSVNRLAKCHDREQSEAAVLVWISYKRDPDRKAFVTRAIYFVASDGSLVAPSISRLTDEEGNVVFDIKNFESYTDMILNHSEKFGTHLEPDEWDAIYPLNFERWYEVQ